MNRRALIIFSPNSDPENILVGPNSDNDNYRDYLMSRAGGNWRSSEIVSMEDPDSGQVLAAIRKLTREIDFTLTIFTGHGFVDPSNNVQYLVLNDVSIPIIKLANKADRQAIIIDACRGYYRPYSEEIMKAFSDIYESQVGVTGSTRELYDDAVMRADKGITVLYAATESESALDTDNGGAYLLSLLKAAELWEEKDKSNLVLDLKRAHQIAVNYLQETFITGQTPSMNVEKRKIHFPFSVKFAPLNG